MGKTKEKDCEVCGDYYKDFHDDEEAKKNDLEALADGNRCVSCYEEYGDHLWPDNIE